MISVTGMAQVDSLVLSFNLVSELSNACRQEEENFLFLVFQADCGLSDRQFSEHIKDGN